MQLLRISPDLLVGKDFNRTSEPEMSHAPSLYFVPSWRYGLIHPFLLLQAALEVPQMPFFTLPDLNYRFIVGERASESIISSSRQRDNLFSKPLLTGETSLNRAPQRSITT